MCVCVCVRERERESNLKILISIECCQNNCFNVEGLAIETENIDNIVRFFSWHSAIMKLSVFHSKKYIETFKMLSCE